MTPNVVEVALGALGPKIAAAAAERLGEEPAAVALALQAAVPYCFRFVIELGRFHGIDTVLQAIRGTDADKVLADPLSRLEQSPWPPDVTRGEKLPGLLADYAGIKESSGQALQAMAAGVTWSVLAQLVSPSLNNDSLAQILRDQEDNVERAFPPGFDLRGA